MTSIRRSGFQLLSTFLLLALCAAALPVHAQVVMRHGRVITTTMHSAALEHNLLGDPADQRVDVYLPPSYDEHPERRFPVLYLLHGFLGSPSDFTKPAFQNMTVQGAMDTLVSTGRGREMIVVVPNGRNRYGGSFYVNSVVTGNWADYITRDLVSWTDSHYRTVATAASRGIAGHSMGGYASIRFGMEHPELFSVVYGIAPCCLDEPREFPDDSPIWQVARNAKSADELWALVNKGDVWPIHVVAAAAAWSPDPSRVPLLAEFPVRSNGTFDSSVSARWRQHFPVQLAASHANALKQLRGLRFEVGTTDEYKHILPAANALSRRLTDLGIPHDFEVYAGGHRDHLGARMSSQILPFFFERLQFPEN